MTPSLKHNTPLYAKGQLVWLADKSVCRVIRDPYIWIGEWLYEHPRIVGPLVVMACMISKYCPKPYLTLVK